MVTLADGDDGVRGDDVDVYWAQRRGFWRIVTLVKGGGTFCNYLLDCGIVRNFDGFVILWRSKRLCSDCTGVSVAPAPSLVISLVNLPVCIGGTI